MTFDRLLAYGRWTGATAVNPHGLRRGSIGFHLAVAAACLAPAGANARAGPSSSVSIEISLTVASRYELRSSLDQLRPPVDLRPTGYCIKTNGDLPALPIMIGLVGEHTRPTQKFEPIAELRPCGSAARAAAHSHMPQLGSAILLIRPE